MKTLSKNQNPFGPFFRKIVSEPQAKHYRRMRNAIWLYLYLMICANPKTGKLTACVSDIAESMGHSEATISSWLGHLRKWHYVSLEKQKKSLHLKISQWKDIFDVPQRVTLSQSDEPIKGRKKSLPKAPAKDVLPPEPVKMAQQIAEEFKAVTSFPYFEKLCRSYPRELILKAYNKAKAIPADKIKKSRGALFVYLIKKYAQE
jgi:hypothetical protein